MPEKLDAIVSICKEHTQLQYPSLIAKCCNLLTVLYLVNNYIGSGVTRKTSKLIEKELVNLHFFQGKKTSL